MSNWQGNLNRVVQKFKTLISKTKFALFFKQVQFIFKIPGMKNFHFTSMHLIEQQIYFEKFYGSTPQ